MKKLFLIFALFLMFLNQDLKAAPFLKQIFGYTWTYDNTNFMNDPSHPGGLGVCCWNTTMTGQSWVWGNITITVEYCCPCNNCQGIPHPPKNQFPMEIAAAETDAIIDELLEIQAQNISVPTQWLDPGYISDEAVMDSIGKWRLELAGYEWNSEWDVESESDPDPIPTPTLTVYVPQAYTYFSNNSILSGLKSGNLYKENGITIAYINSTLYVRCLSPLKGNDAKEMKISIFNTSGQLIDTYDYIRNSLQSEHKIKGVTKGIYLVSVYSNGKIFNDKIIIN